MSNTQVIAASLGEKPPFNIHDALCGRHDLFYGADETVNGIITKAGDQARILDFRSASGQWVQAVAQRFPKANVVGEDDKDPSPVLPPAPANLSFLKVPTIANNVVPDVEGDFDVIHARAASATVLHFPTYIKSFVEKLRPGGIVLLMSGELALFNEKKERIEDSANHQIVRALYNWQFEKGLDMDSMYKWKETLTNIGSELGIKLAVHQEELTLPFKKDASYEGSNYTARFMEDTVHFFSKLISTITPEIRQKALDELRALESNEGVLAGAHLRWQFAYAIREPSS